MAVLQNWENGIFPVVLQLEKSAFTFMVAGCGVIFLGLYYQHELCLREKKTNEDMSSTLFSSLFEGDIQLDRNGNVTGWSGSATSMTGYPGDIAMGKNLVKLLMMGVACADRLRALADFPGSFLPEEVDSGIRHSSGRVLWVSFRIENSPEAAPDHIRLFIKDATPTERIKAHLLPDCGEIENLACMLTNEIRLPIRKIEQSLRCLEKEVPAEQGIVRSYLNEVDLAINKMDVFVRELSDYLCTGGPVPVSTWCNLAEVVETARCDLKKAGILLRAGDLPLVKADRSRLLVFFRHLFKWLSGQPEEKVPRLLSMQMRRETYGITFFIRLKSPVPTEPGLIGSRAVAFEVCRKILGTYGGAIRVHEDEDGCYVSFNMDVAVQARREKPGQSSGPGRHLRVVSK